MDRLRRFVHLHVVIWRFGGEPERVLLLVMCATAYLFLPGVLIWLFVSVWILPVPFEFVVTVGLSLSNFLTMINLLSIALFTKDSWSQLLSLGQFPIHEVEAGEFLDFLQKYGTNGRLPTLTHLAFEFWGVLYGLVLLSVAFGLWVLPFIGPATPVAFLAIDAPIVLGCRWYSHRKLPIIYRKRDSSSAQLSEPTLASTP